METEKFNFTLSDWQIKNIHDIFHFITAQISPESKNYLNILFKKITKLNELAKQREEGNDNE